MHKGMHEDAPMNWEHTAKACGLAAFAERTATAGRIFEKARSGWAGNDVWTTRVKAPRTVVTQSAKRGPLTSSQKGTALQD
jgi:hypothetical protein